MPNTEKLTQSCTQCGQISPQIDLLPYENERICSDCKLIFFQKVREGVKPVASKVELAKRSILFRLFYAYASSLLASIFGVMSFIALRKFLGIDDLPMPIRIAIFVGVFPLPALGFLAAVKIRLKTTWQETGRLLGGLYALLFVLALLTLLIVILWDKANIPDPYDYISVPLLITLVPGPGAFFNGIFCVYMIYGSETFRWLKSSSR